LVCGKSSFELELAHAQACTALWNIPDEKLRQSIQAYLDQVQKHVREYLDRSDHALADLVKSDFSGICQAGLSSSLARYPGAKANGSNSQSLCLDDSV